MIYKITRFENLTVTFIEYSYIMYITFILINQIKANGINVKYEFIKQLTQELIVMRFTLTTKWYRTVSSMLLMFRWRTSNERLSKTLIIFATWPGILWEITFRITFEPEIFTSTSATEELQLAPSSLKEWSVPIPEELSSWRSVGCCVLGLGPGLGLTLFLLFWDSKAWSTWCNSLMNSITPPIIDAWSP